MTFDTLSNEAKLLHVIHAQQLAAPVWDKTQLVAEDWKLVTGWPVNDARDAWRELWEWYEANNETARRHRPRAKRRGRL